MASVDTMTELSAPARAAMRDLILALADSKRLLGMRYGEWILGSPELEAGIACASMAQDEWGHARLLYALLKDFDEDVSALEHEREATEYANIEALDTEPADWFGVVALNALVDTAISVQCDALRGSSHPMLAQRIGKMLDEERFHAAHGEAWFRRLARANEETRGALADAVEAVFPIAMRWFGPNDSERAAAVRDAGLANAAGDELRERFLERVGPLLDELGERGQALRAMPVDFEGFDEVRRRASAGGPDARTLEQVRGDKNRIFLMD